MQVQAVAIQIISASDDGSQLEELPELCLERASKGPLPDLSGDLDDFFDEVEHPELSVGATKIFKSDSKPVYDSSSLTTRSLPAFSLTPLFKPCLKAPTIAKLLQGHFEASDNVDGMKYMNNDKFAFDNVEDMQLLT